MRTAAHEAAEPKYAHLERERRWLVDVASLDVSALADAIVVCDRYILGTRMRLREMICGEDRVWKLTRKYECADPLARPIVTAYLDQGEFEVLAGLPAVTLTKTRFKLADHGNDFSVDRFDGPLQGLWLAEIELEDGATLTSLPNPTWTIADVSHDPRYQGYTLAQCGIPKD